MANFTLPNGSTVAIAGSVATAVAITGITNANPAVATAANSYTDGDFVVIDSGWSKLSGRVVRVLNSSGTDFELEGVDTSDVNVYPAGVGAGTAAAATALTQISGILNTASSGGDQNYWTGAALEDDHETRIPTTKSASGIDFDVSDDPTQAWYGIVQAANDDRQGHIVKITLSSGSVLLYYAYVSMGDIPTLTRDQPMTVKVTLSLKGAPTRYAAA